MECKRESFFVALHSFRSRGKLRLGRSVRSRVGPASRSRGTRRLAAWLNSEKPTDYSVLTSPGVSGIISDCRPTGRGPDEIQLPLVPRVQPVERALQLFKLLSRFGEFAFRR